MIRARLWFRCAAMHDPVTPTLIQPAVIGWEAKQRRVDLQIERAFNGDELVRRMKGWVTVDPNEAVEVVNRFGRLKVLDDRELVIDATISEKGGRWDLTRYPNGNFAQVMSGATPGQYSVPDSTNHIKKDYVPWGGNMGFLDGHLEWRKFGNPQAQSGAIMFKRFGADAQGFWW